MLPVSLYCFLFSSVFVLCTQCCQFLVCPMLPVLSYCVPYVASFSGLFLTFSLSSSCVPLCCQFLWIVFCLFAFVLCTLCCQFLCIVLVIASVFVLCTLCCQFLCIVFCLFVFVLCTLCCQFLWIVRLVDATCLRLVYPMSCFSVIVQVLPVSLVLCTLCCQFLWIVFVCLCLVYPMLPVSLDCPFCLSSSSSCVTYVVSFSVCPMFLVSLACLRLVYPMLPVSLDCFCLFVFVLCTQCCQFLWIVFHDCPLCLSSSLCTLCCQFLCIVFVFSNDCLRPCLVPNVASFSGLSMFVCPSSCVPYVVSFSVLF